MARPKLSDYEKAVRACCRAHIKYKELADIARTETDKDRAAIAQINQSRRGRPTHTARDLAKNAFDEYQDKLKTVRQLESEEGLDEMSEFDIQIYSDPVAKKPKGAGYSGRPKNNIIDELESTIRRIRRRIAKIESGQEASGRSLTKAQKIEGCQQQIADIQIEIELYESKLTNKERAFQEIKRARYSRITSAKALQILQSSPDASRLALETALHKAKESERFLGELESQYKEKYGEFKNDDCGASDLERRVVRNNLAAKHAESLKKTRKSSVSRRIKTDDTSIERRFKNK